MAATINSTLLLPFLITWFLCLIAESESSSTPSINITYSIGQNAELRCRVEQLGKKTVTWRRLSDPVPISVGTVKFSPAKKYRIAYDKSTNEWKLFIKRLDVSDAGEYECRITGKDGASKTISLIMPGKHHTHIESTETIFKVDVGESVVLPCKIVNLKKHKVMWIDQLGQVLTFRKKVYAEDTRIRVVHSNREEWSLRIRNVNDNDFGTYTCLVNTNPVLTRTITLANKGPARQSPSFIRIDHVGSIRVKEGSPATLKCQFDGHPEVKVSWSARVFVGNKRVKKTFDTVGDTFKIERATPEDTGNYTCSGRNGIAPSARGKVKLFVEVKPTTPAPKTTPAEPTGPSTPITYPENERVGQRKGQNAFLVCHSVGKPGPSMYWKRHGSNINNSYKHRIRTFSDGQHRRKSELRILHVVTQDFGDYECFGHNNRGHTGTKVTLVETFD